MCQGNWVQAKAGSLMEKLKCPVQGCGQQIEADTELNARIKLIAHIATKHIEPRISNSMGILKLH
jgi:hypothetical protein